MTPAPLLRRGLAIALLAATVQACGPSPDVYGSDRTMQANRVAMGTISGSRAVETRHVARGDRVAGALVGGAAGALAGNSLTDDDTGAALLAGLGAVAGAAGGSELARTANRTASREWFVDLDSGQSISVIQNDPRLSVGARVRVIQDGRTTRLVKAHP